MARKMDHSLSMPGQDLCNSNDTNTYLPQDLSEHVQQT